ncbi:unnamed protein product [Cuscuta campestris]|uniref:Uncharacterized protein n=1 Tax=Cuscuta campestris TaxID=132261 RepID=A0A484N8H4_9ASTE|nr:unnamed protein product [Cuscuta campestris]
MLNPSIPCTTASQVLHPLIHKLVFIYGDEKLPTQVIEAELERCLLNHKSIKTESSKKTGCSILVKDYENVKLRRPKAQDVCFEKWKRHANGAT